MRTQANRIKIHTFGVWLVNNSDKDLIGNLSTIEVEQKPGVLTALLVF
jgi:hypothetical protein